MFLVNVFVFYLFSSALALVNVTIDDTNGDPNTGTKITYTPSGYWTLGPDCTTCSAKADPSQAYQQTWRDTSYIPPEDPMSAEISFIGSAVYVYGILGHGNPSWLADDVSFLIDGQELSHYSQLQDIVNQTVWTYNYLFFATDGLSFDKHTLKIVVGGRQGSQSSLFMLDYIIYSTDPARAAEVTAAAAAASKASARRAKIGLIVGVVFGVLGAIGLVAAALFFVFRRRQPSGALARWGTSVTTPTPANTEMGFRSLQSLDSRSAPAISSFPYATPPIPSTPVTMSQPTSDSSLSQSRTTTSGGFQKGQRQSTVARSAGSDGRMADTALTLAAEVRRLRDENDRLRDAGSSRSGLNVSDSSEEPPPYLH